MCRRGGLLFSQFITLYLTPVVYLYLARLQSRMQRVTSAHLPEDAFLAPTGD